MSELMQKNSTISAADAALFLVTGFIDDTLRLINEQNIKPFGLPPKKKIKLFKWLLELS